MPLLRSRQLVTSVDEMVDDAHSVAHEASP
jgi:hypothetical protein